MSPPASLTALRQRIREIERPAGQAVLPFGVAAIDRILPGGGLALGAVHEIVGQDGDEEDGAVIAGFAAGILARLGTREGNRGRFRRSLSAPGGGEGWGEVGDSRTPPTSLVLWCLKQPDLYGPGLREHGLDPMRLVLAVARRDDELLWAIEEGLRTGPAAGLAAVVGEIGRLPMVASRRLQLAAEHSGITTLLLRRWRTAAEAAAERDRPSAALTRWRIAALPSPAEGKSRVGTPRWQVELLRCRGGVPGTWIVEAADATGHVSLSAELADRPVAPAEPQTGDIGTAWRRAG